MQGAVEVVLNAIDVGLQDAGPARKIAGWMFLPAVGGEVVERRGGRPTAERPVMPQIGPEPGSLCAPLASSGTVVSSIARQRFAYEP